jgi:prepilin-type N-terminal cleavage/methylation domain-containing protein
MVRRGFTLVELIVALGIVAIMAAVGVGIYTGIQRKSNDNIAIGVADQVSSNMAHYAAFNMGLYPAGLAAASWTTTMQALGSYAEFSQTTPSIFTSPGAFQAYSDGGGSTFQLAFKAAGGTGTWYCRDPNGLAALSTAPSGNGPWSGCP